MSPILQRRPVGESLFERLEREGNNDFHLLDELGPAQFGTDHLLELRGKMRRRLAAFDRRQRLSMTLGGTAAGWFFLGFLVFRLYGRFWMAMAAFALGTLCLFGFFGILLFLKKKYESRGEIEFGLREIETELKRRQRAVKF